MERENSQSSPTGFESSDVFSGELVCVDRVRGVSGLAARVRTGLGSEVTAPAHTPLVRESGGPSTRVIDHRTDP